MIRNSTKTSQTAASVATPLTANRLSTVTVPTSLPVPKTVRHNKSFLIPQSLAFGLTLLCISTASHLPDANAAIFKCTDANGSVSYSQMPCPTTEQIQKVIASKSAKRVKVDCRIANNFARKTASQMRAGQSSGELFASYGGIDALPRTSIGVINYVYSHKDNTNTGVQRITALSAARCSAGSYGSVSCDDFPYAFISDLGGCENATRANVPSTLPIAEKVDQPAPAADETAGTAALGLRTTANEADNKCRTDLKSRMNDLFDEMQNSQSAESDSKLQKRQLTLSQQLNAC